LGPYCKQRSRKNDVTPGKKEFLFWNHHPHLTEWTGHTLGLNFIKDLHTALKLAESKSVKKTVKLSIFYACRIYNRKAVCRMLMKLSLGVDFINNLRTAFTCIDPKSVKIQFSNQYLFTLLGSAQEKYLHRMLMKLTLGQANGWTSLW